MKVVVKEKKKGKDSSCLACIKGKEREEGAKGREWEQTQRAF